jgi:hypothetical protein
MKSFIENLNEMKSASYYKTLYKRLNASQRALLDQLAAELAPIELHERERKINRLFIDNLTPPKNHRIIIELLANANAKCYFQHKKRG